MQDKEIDVNSVEELSVNVDDSINLLDVLRETLESIDGASDSLVKYEVQRLLPRLMTLCICARNMNAETHDDIYKIVNKYLKG